MKSLFPPPFDPDERQTDTKAVPRLRDIPLRMLIPNLITLGGLYAGLTAIRMAFDGRYEFAVELIMLAAVLDALDGRAARLLKSSSRFGAELDSLADFVNFGVAPAIVIYSWTLESLGPIGWIASVLFAIAMVLRLARFNVLLDDPKRPDWMGNFFVGMPAPAAAMTLMLPLYMAFIGVENMTDFAPLILVYVVVLSYLTVSRIPTFSGKKMGVRIAREWVVPIFGAAVLFVALLSSYLWHMLCVLSVGYLLSIPWGVHHYRKLEKRSMDRAAAKPQDESLAEQKSE